MGPHEDQARGVAVQDKAVAQQRHCEAQEDAHNLGKVQSDTGCSMGAVSMDLTPVTFQWIVKQEGIESVVLSGVMRFGVQGVRCPGRRPCPSA